MKNTFTLFLFLFSVMAYSQSDEKIKEVKDEILELRKQGDSQMKLFNDGTYCKNYFPDWSDFKFRPLRSYLPPKTSAEADALASKAEEDVQFLEDLKSNYLRPNGAFYQYQTDYKKVLDTKEKIRQLEKDINEYPYPLVWGERAACSNIIDRINEKIRDYKNEAKNLRGLSAELSDATDFSKTNEANNDNSNSDSQSKSGQQLELSSGTDNNYLNTTGTSNKNSQESPAEKAARLDRERGAEIMQETQENIARVKANSDNVGDDLGAMFQNGVTTQGFYNMGQSFYGLNTDAGALAGSLSNLAGAGLGIVNALKAERDENIRVQLEVLEEKSPELQSQYNQLEKYARDNDYAQMNTVNENLNEIESEMMFRFYWLSRKGPKKQRNQFYDNYENFKTNYTKRITLFQELNTQLFIKNVVDDKPSEKEVLEQYIHVGHKEFVNAGKEYEYFKFLKKMGAPIPYKEFSNMLRNGRLERIKLLKEAYNPDDVRSMDVHLVLMEDALSTNRLNCIADMNCDKTNVNNIAAAFNNLDYAHQKEIIENILYKSVPSLTDDIKVLEDYTYKGTLYVGTNVRLLMSEKFKTNMYMAIYSPYAQKEMPLYSAIKEKSNSDNKLNRLVNKRVALDEEITGKKTEQLFEERKHLTQKNIE